MSTEPQLTQRQRSVLIASMLANGISQTEIAKQLGISLSTVKRDIEDIRPGIEQAAERIKTLQDEIAQRCSIQERAARYAELATKAKNEAVSLGALQRIDDLDGIVTDKERIRAKRDDPGQAGPMFVFNGGLNIDFGGGAVQAKPQHIVDVKPEPDTHSDSQE
jgi:predicted transcriptional regulator